MPPRLKFPCGGICTVEADLARSLCYAKRIDLVPHEPLRKTLTEFAKIYLTEQAKFGYEYVDADLLHVYGPYWSGERLAHITNPELMKLMHEIQPHLVVDSDPDRRAYAQYVVVGNFKAATRSARLLLSSALGKESGLIGVH